MTVVYATAFSAHYTTDMLDDTLSVLGKRWCWRTEDSDAVQALCRYLEVPELLARVLVGRGQDIDTAMDFLSPTLRSLLPDPFHLKDMDKATERLMRAIKAGERIAVFGDYDVDGATSTALLIHYFRALGIALEYHIPDRQKEGYGPNAPALLALKEKGVSLVITVDCGAVSFAPLKAAREAGLDVMVIDHHKGAAELPEAVAVVNPNRLDESSPHGHLAAVGVVFLTLVALNKCLREEGYFIDRKEPRLLDLLDVVAIGTICDVVPLNGINRAFAVQGLQVASARRNQGLAALLQEAGVYGAVNAYHAGFVIGPRINAGGRVGEADLGVRLLTSESAKEHQQIASLLSQYNAERQAIERDVLDAAMQQAESQANQPMIMVHGEAWHSGVIGIVASRIKERFDRPTAVIAVEPASGIGKASARSVSGVDIGAVIVAAREQGVITEGGGHSMAGGFSLPATAIEQAQLFFIEQLEARMQHYLESRSLKLDGRITTRMATPELVAELERAAPYGSGNPSPVLLLPDAKVVAMDVLKEQHVRLVVTDASGGRLKVMCFRAIGSGLCDVLLGSYGKTVHLAGSLKCDAWQGREQVTFMLYDIKM